MFDPGVRVDRRALGDERVDIGHGHEDLHRPGGKALADRELVEIARIVVVDRAPGQRREVADARIVVCDPARRSSPAASGHACRELGLQAAVDHGLGGDADQVAAVVMVTRLRHVNSEVLAHRQSSRRMSTCFIARVSTL